MSMDTNTRSVLEEFTFTIGCRDVILREIIVTDLDELRERR